MVGIFILVLSTFVFSAVQHDSVFTISTTETSYNIEDNAYSETNPSSGVRFSFIAPSDNSFYIKFSKKSNGNFRLYYCNDDSFLICNILTDLNEETSSFIHILDNQSKESISYYRIIASDNSETDYSKNFEVKYSIVPHIYPLSSNYTGFTFENNSSTTLDNQYGIHTSFKASESSYYAIITKTPYAYNLILYPDSTFESKSLTTSCASNGYCKKIFYIEQDSVSYVLLNQPYNSHLNDSIYAKVEKSIKINADTSGTGSAYVGKSSRNYDSSYFAFDTIPLSTNTYTDKFNHWEIVSGKCTFLDSSLYNTKLIAEEDCRIKAVFTPAINYEITQNIKKYTTAANYSIGVNYSSGIKFYFVTKDSGAYIFNFDNENLKSFNIEKNLFSNKKTQSSIKSISFSDTLIMQPGDSLVYLISNNNARDSMDIISVNYTPIKIFTATIKNPSEHCSTDSSTYTTYNGGIVDINAKCEEGYRPNGWKILNGTKNIIDSSAANIRLKLTSDVTLQLNYTTPQLIKIDDIWREYTINNNLYEKDPIMGIRFIFTTPTSDSYIVKVGGANFYGYVNNYENDSTFINHFYTNQRIYGDTVSFYITPNKAPKNYYFLIKGDNKNYYDSPIGIRAEKALWVQVDSNTTYWVAAKDSIGIETTPPTGKHFSHWEVVAGKGSFTDSTEISTHYKPKSDSSKIKAVFKDLPIYKLTDKWKTFTLKNNGTQTLSKYSIRTSYKASDSGSTFILQIKNYTYNNVGIYYINDSTFASYKSRNVMGDTIKKFSLTPTTKDSTFYFLFELDTTHPLDSIIVRVIETSKITFDTTTQDTTNILSYFNENANTLITGDSVQIQVKSYHENRFDHWKVVSGNCKLADSSQKITILYVTGDCHLKPISKSGTMYKITETPQKYTSSEHYFAGSPQNGVKFSFIAPDSGNYTFVVSRKNSKNTIYERYPTSDFSNSYSKRTQLTGTITETVPMGKGDSAFFLIKHNNLEDSLTPFWISYSTSSSTLTITADSNGNVNPNTYKPIYNNAKYNIYAYGKKDYRFDQWNVLFGDATIDDIYAPRAMISVKNDAVIRATFRKNQVINLTRDFQTFNFKEDYFTELNNFHIRFSWTPPDTNTYVIQLESIDHLSGILIEYRDSTFESTKAKYKLSENLSVTFKGEANQTLYWSVQDSLPDVPDKKFKARIGSNYTLQVAESLQGTTTPKGNIDIFPYKDTTITAWAYGGYVFNKWVIDSGNVTIENDKKAKTRFTAIDSFCIVHPTFTLDFTITPELQISTMDLTNHPSICAQVSVTDKNTGKAIAGLDSTNFILFQDSESLPIQTTTLQEITGISVALVVDESGSMGAVRQKAAKTALSNFITAMGPYDKAAIIGFRGNDVVIHQSITSNTDSLMTAINNLIFSGGTNINEGTYIGIAQISKETNPTAVIVFSDGENQDNEKTNSVIKYANKNNTAIYTIGLESKSTNPLLNLADSTGGKYSYAANADSLTDIYEEIRGNIQSRYVICYDSPDKKLNHGEHEVIINTNINGKTSKDTVTWSEDFLPPKITLTQATQDMIGVNQKPGDSIVIGAYISTTTFINVAKIYLRQSSIPSNSFQSINMIQVNDSLWTFTIPQADVQGPGIDFYIIAEESTGLLGKTPTVPAPSREPYTIPIGNDAPIIKRANNECIDTTSAFGNILFDISDSNGIYQSFIYFKDSLDILYMERSMSYLPKTKKWEAQIPAQYFKEGSAAYYIRAIDSLGTAARSPKIGNKYLTACVVEKPDTSIKVKDSITIVNAKDPKADITRSTNEVAIKLQTISLSSKVDTVTISLKCLKSGDSESNIKMVEKSEGKYENLKPIYKDEYSAKKNNGTISCNANDTLIATYKNMHTKKSVHDTVAISDFVDISYQFLKVKEDTDLDSVKTSIKAKYRLRVTTTSPKMSKIDTINVKLFTHKKDTLEVKAIETDTNSAIFDYVGAFYFAEDSLAMKDSLLDAVLDLTKTKNRIKIQAQLGKDSSKLSTRDSLIIYTNYTPADSAEIYDKNLDGKADFVRIHFMKPLKKNIESIDTVFWPKSGIGSEYQFVKATNIKIENDSTWVQAKLDKTFKYGITTPNASNKPYLRVTKTSSDLSQKVIISDKIGAVPVKAKKHPGKVRIDEYLKPDVKIPPDTLVITLSEGVKSVDKKESWKKLFRYSANCKDTISKPIKIQGNPIIDSAGIQWTIVLDDYSILVGNCISTNSNAQYTDTYGNTLGRGGVEVTGEDGTIYLYEVSPNPAVSGIGEKAEWIPPKSKDFENVPDSISTVKVLSIAAYKADIYIYDNQGQFINHLTQKFGYDGELNDPLRGNSSKREKLSYLYWNQRSENGRKVGTGVYIWKISFKFNDKHTEERTLKTGIKRNSENE